MKLLIISDAWEPQTNGVVRTLQETARQLESMGHTVKVIGPQKTFTSFSAPTYPEIRLEFFAHRRLGKILDDFAPDYIHIATEGPLGIAMRRVCVTRKLPFSSAYHTCFPEYFEKRVPRFMGAFVRVTTYHLIKLFHAPSGAVMVTTPTMEALLRARRIKRLVRWSRGVDTQLFKPFDGTPEAYATLPRPLYVYVGRVAVEKNLEAFLSVDVPGTKIIIGSGPDEAMLREKYKNALFLGKKTGEDLARHYAGADVFVFPSKTDTFGLVLLEALACGLAVAAYPVQGPRDVFADKARSAPFVVLDDDLKKAMLAAANLKPDKNAAHAYVATTYSWKACTEQFLSHLQAPTPFARRRVSRYRWTLNLIEILWRKLRTTPKFLPNIYRSLSLALEPLLPTFLEWRNSQGKEDPARLRERLGYASIERPVGKLIWCHAASVGESLSLLPLLQGLKNHPAQPAILLTSGTRTSAELLAKRLPADIIHQYIPLDSYNATQRFLRHWQPDVALITESEIWPNLMEKIRKFEVPAALLNGRMSARSAKNWSGFAELWIRRLLGIFELVLAQSDADATRLKALGAHNVRCVGNLKAAADPLPYNQNDLVKLQNETGTRPCWLMASTHEGEDALALAAHQELVKDFPDLLTIIVPRHLARADSIEQLAHARKLNVARRSAQQPITPATSLYLADTFGEIGLFYKHCPLVCVGGSFVQAGGHNPLEAARFSAAILFGPDMRNTQETATNMLQAGAAYQVNDGAALNAALKNYLANPNTAKEMGERAFVFAENQKQVLARVLLELQPLLDKALHSTS